MSLSSQQLQIQLETQLLAPWQAHSLDPEQGCVYTQLTRDWQPLPGEAQDQVHIAAIDSLSRAYVAGLGETYLEAARQAAAWVNHSGRPQTPVPGFQLAGAFARLHRATGRQAELDTAINSYQALEKCCHDPAHGGYYSTEQTDQPKTLAVQLAALHALRALAEATEDDGYLSRAQAIVDLLADISTRMDYLPDRFTPDWQAVGDTVNYAHQLEAARLLLWAADTFEHTAYRYSAFTWLDHCLDIGWDGERGGFAGAGNAHQVTDTHKRAGVQGQGLAVLARVAWFSLRYQSLFRRQLDWCNEHQYDPTHKGWYTACEPDGTPAAPHKDSAAHLSAISALLDAVDALRAVERQH